MMSEVIRQETLVFLISVCHGGLLTFAYDVLRSFRRAFPHNLAAVSAEDFLYWMTAGFLTFCLTFLKTDGVIRGYVVVGIGIGAVLYHQIFSRWMIRGMVWIFGLLRKTGGFCWKILSVPAEKTKRVFQKIIEFAGKTSYNVFAICRKHRHSRRKRGRPYGRKKKTSKQK